MDGNDLDVATQNVLRSARTMIIDLANGWPVKELHTTPQKVVKDITGLLGDGDDPETQEELGRLRG